MENKTGGKTRKWTLGVSGGLVWYLWQNGHFHPVTGLKYIKDSVPALP